MSWPTVQITKVARVVGGATPKSQVAEYWEGAVQWATPKDLSDLPTQFIRETPRTITEAGLKSCAAEVIPEGSVLFSSRAPIGHIAITKTPMATNQGFKSFVPGPRLDAGFLYWWLDANRERLQALGTGATFKELSKATVQRIEIPLPPLEEQKRIAGILDQAADLCRLRTRALDKLNTLGQAIFHEMFGSVHSNPHGFERVFLGDLIKVSSGQGLTAKDMIPGNFPVYGGNGINGYHNEGPVGANRIVIGRVGVYCGAVHVTRQPCWVTDNALLVRQLQPCSVTYLAEALRVADLNQYAGRAAQPLISGSRIYPVEILLPPEDQQRRFEEALQATSRQHYAVERASSKIGDLFASLQHRAFRGEL